MTEAERPFDTRELAPGQEREPQTPAERVVYFGDKLRGILSTLPMSDPEMLARTGGALGMVREYLAIKAAFEAALFENAKAAENQEVLGCLINEASPIIRYSEAEWKELGGK